MTDATAKVQFEYTTQSNTVKCVLCGDDIKSDLPVKPLCSDCIDHIILRADNLRLIILARK